MKESGQLWSDAGQTQCCSFKANMTTQRLTPPNTTVGSLAFSLGVWTCIRHTAKSQILDSKLKKVLLEYYQLQLLLSRKLPLKLELSPRSLRAQFKLQFPSMFVQVHVIYVVLV